MTMDSYPAARVRPRVRERRVLGRPHVWIVVIRKDGRRVLYPEALVSRVVVGQRNTKKHGAIQYE